MYISFKDKNGNWKKAVHVKYPINSASIDYCPYVSPDEKILFFTSSRTDVDATKQYSFTELMSVLNRSENGLEKVYSVSFDSLKKLNQ